MENKVEFDIEKFFDLTIYLIIYILDKYGTASHLGFVWKEKKNKVNDTQSDICLKVNK